MPELSTLKPDSLKILCVCRRGNSRSVALAYLLKKHVKQEAIAIGIRQHSASTKAMLYGWADLIILVDERFLPEVPQEYRNKLKVWHVGTDRFFKGFDKELVEMYKEFIRSEGWQI